MLFMHIDDSLMSLKIYEKLQKSELVIIYSTKTLRCELDLKELHCVFFALFILKEFHDP
jgi:hypothetical protein